MFRRHVQDEIPGAVIVITLNRDAGLRKELGINKSTLWYIQKNLRDGKKVKIYDKVKAKIV